MAEKTLKSRRRQNRLVRALAVILSIVVLLASAIGIYAADYYRAEEDAVTAFSTGERHGRYTVFRAENPIVGFVFYPGGKVDHTAYAPLMQKLAACGISAVLVEMPMKLAILDKDAYTGAVTLLPEIEHWFIGGHSLGGAMASDVFDKEIFRGLVLLAAYPTKEIPMPVLSIYGDRDTVLNKETYTVNMYQYATVYKREFSLSGANHAGFGLYGKQAGDSRASITPDAQQNETVRLIEAFVLSMMPQA